MDDHDTTVAAVVDYCETQARLLSGRAERLTTEIDDLLDEIDAEAAAVRERLDPGRERTEGTEQPSGPVDQSSEEAAVAELEAKQEEVAQRQARLEEVNDLSAGYADLAATISEGEHDADEALTEVLEFEARTEAHTLFDERETLLETAIDE